MIESADRLEIRSPLRAPMRVLFAGLGLFPLLAPYELLLRVEWQSYLHPFFFLAALVSAGAALVSYAHGAPVVRGARRVYPISAARCMEVGERQWSDGAPGYYLRIVMNDGTAIEGGSSSSRDEVEAIKIRVEAFIAGKFGTASETCAGASR